MPFLFERIDDETELLLPDNLLHSDSLIRKLVSEIDEEDWQEVEIIGWLYQFYISEKKDEVIGKVVASEDIPAATQLFTPNWIVKYLVQNTLGRQWLATYPQSALRQQMAYYIEPAEQTPEVQEQLKAITPTSLNPEELTLLDPACGSGHILVEGVRPVQSDLPGAGLPGQGHSPADPAKEPVRPGDRRPGGAACGLRPDDEGPCRRPPHLRPGDAAERRGVVDRPRG